MYKHYFHFSKLPFSIVPDPECLYLSPRHKEGLAHLLYGITDSDGFVTLTGEIGTGKTTLCRSLLEQLPENIDVAFILNPKLGAVELMATICDELGIKYSSQQQCLKDLSDLLNLHLLATHAKGKRTVLLIDEAQNLSHEVLEQIRLLTNLETTQAKLLQIVLVGQPELRQKLNEHRLRQLNQRITARYHLESLSRKETKNYIRYRLSVCGGNPKLISNRAIQRIFKLTRGVPRLINLLCDRSLLGAYATGKKAINPSVVNKAASEVLPYTAKNFPFRRTFFSAISILTLMGVAFYFNADWVLWKNVNKQTSSVTSNVATDILSKPDPSVNLKTDRQEKQKQSFSEYISNPEFTMDSALLDLIETWSIKFNPDQSVDCDFIQQTGLRCLFAQESWENMLALNRPVILEFSLGDENKHYAFLVGTEKGLPVFRFKDEIVFPLDDVLPYWQGYFMMVWQAPSKKMDNIHPQEISDDVLWLRKKLAAIDKETVPMKDPRFYDKTLEKRVILFQKQHDLVMDGVVGPRTIIHLQNQTNIDNFPTYQPIEKYQ